MSTLSSLGEFGLIRRLTQNVHPGEGVLTGIGDDCAVLRLGDRQLLVTCDASIEDVHFRRALAAPEAIGWKSAASALSDIAAMGGQPRFVLITLACPAETDLGFLEGVYRGMADAVAHCGAVIVGGDTTQSPSGLVIDVTVIGEPTGSRHLLRCGACEGDYLAVTGHPGCSAAGLLALERHIDAPSLVPAHLHPIPRIAEGQWLAEQHPVHAAIDLSDGLLQDAGHLADASGLGLDLDSRMLPLDPALTAFCAAQNVNALDLALNGGEEYELILALRPDEAAAIATAFTHRFQVPLALIGRFTSHGSGLRMDGAPIQPLGFNHFRG